MKSYQGDRMSGSVLHGSDGFVNKLLSRKSSAGQSSRRDCWREPGKVPFKWEVQPGIPKHKDKEDDAVPNEAFVATPVSSPPAMPTPLQMKKPKSSSTRYPTWACFRQLKNKKGQRLKNNDNSAEFGHCHCTTEHCFTTSDDDFLSSPNRVSKSSCSSSTTTGSPNSSAALALPSFKFCKLAKGLLRRLF